MSQLMQFLSQVLIVRQTAFCRQQDASQYWADGSLGFGARDSSVWGTLFDASCWSGSSLAPGQLAFLDSF